MNELKKWNTPKQICLPNKQCHINTKLFILVGWGRSFLSVACPTGVQLEFFFCSGFQFVIRLTGISIVGQLTESVESSFLIHQGDYHD